MGRAIFLIKRIGFILEFLEKGEIWRDHVILLTRKKIIMIELNLIQEQYARMTDNELQLFAINESDKLTMESFHLLKGEFEKRNLDLSIIESAEIDKSLAELGKRTTFEKITEYEFTESLWQFALDEKEEAKSDLEIYNSLLNKGVDEKYAFMLVQSLDSKAKQLKENCENQIISGWVVGIVGIVAIFLVMNETVSGIFLLYGLILVLLGILRLFKSYAKKEKYQKISDNIKMEKDSIKEN